MVIHARALRASLSEAAAHPPRLSVEGIDLAFITAPGGALFFLKQAGELHIHAKAGPGDQGAAYLEIDRAEAQGAGVIAAIADGRPTTLIADTLYSHASALSGSDADLALRHWAAAGGRATIRHVSLVAGSAGLEARAGEIGADGEGRLAGSISLKAREATRMIARLGAANLIAPEAARAAATVIGVRQAGGGVSLGLNFQAGRTTLGPVAIGAAPKLF